MPPPLPKRSNPSADLARQVLLIEATGNEASAPLPGFLRSIKPCNTAEDIIFGRFC
jgi:hypothetical protein